MSSVVHTDPLVTLGLASVGGGVQRERPAEGRVMPQERLPTILGAPHVAVVDASEEISELLQLVLEDEGLRTVVVAASDVKRGRQHLETFLRGYDPPVVVWDIAIPYAENWADFLHIRDSAAGQGRRFVLTTTNPRALPSLVDEAPAPEVVGKPFDLDALVGAVRRALGGAP